MGVARYCISAAVLGACLMLGCQRDSGKRYELRGKVVSVDAEQRRVTVEHEEIKGFMDAMTMPFNIGDDWALSVLKPGQTIEATLVVKHDRSWIEGIRISQRAMADITGTSGSMPKIGDEVPDFQLINQDNQRIHLAAYRGNSLLITFIYTRCPLPDFCPRTSMKFSQVYQDLKSTPPAGSGPHLLTISFDPEHDTPQVLREYAGRFMHPIDFKRWEFATGSKDEIRAVTSYFGLAYSPESGQITHNLVTALIGADGKLIRVYQGKDWTPAQILAELK